MITLRALEPEDLDALYAIENDSEAWACGCTNVPFSRVVLSEYIAHQQADIYVDGQLRLVIETNGEGLGNENVGKMVVGLADLANFDARNLRAEVSIIINKEWRGRGIATEALLRLVDYVRDFLMLEQLFAVIAEGNKASMRLFAKCGFEQTATFRGWLKTPTCRVDAHFFQLFLKK